ncbi:uncharacterized mitochondrial protein AtMg00810-like [Benincasa hispida]|uniref:uncharacterized mitochondrial protein AtMg00810-like n=1 Tax=Benincasa hispida TaxID=102211 RepID=UPI0019019C05|nr:uncharacterized mitochondrial protein AtMg00810-like [Benincasa hispida]
MTEYLILKKNLANDFQIKDLGTLKYFLGMEFVRSLSDLKMAFLSTIGSIFYLLNETSLLGCKIAETPIEQNLKLVATKEKEKYQRLVGRLIYLSHTRLDITFTVSVVSQFIHAPGSVHFEAVYRILRYLKGTPRKGILFTKHDHLNIEVYTNVDWAGSTTDRRSTSRYFSFVGGNLVTWRSKKKSVVARSSTEAEFRALAHGICEGIWIRRLLEELNFSQTMPIRIYYDNKSTIPLPTIQFFMIGPNILKLINTP